MKFKAQVERPQPLIRMLQALSVMANRCILVLAERDWSFHVTAKYIDTHAPETYSRVDIEDIFSKYHIQSQSNNQIVLEIEIKNIFRAFKSSQASNGNLLLIKLTKKHNVPILCFETWQDTGETNSINLFLFFVCFFLFYFCFFL